MIKIILKLSILSIFAVGLTGCVAAAAGAGAAGGYMFNKNYDVDITKKDNNKK
jgi:hypothetical protein